MRALFTKLGRLVLALFGLVARFQNWVLTKVCPLIPGWRAVEAFCRRILAPVHALGGFVQRKIPVTRKLEWLLEIDGLRGRHPVLLVFALTMVFIRGMQTTQYGHVATDTLIYPLLGGLSYLNPFLGLVSAIVFGAGDFLQKVLSDDIYYSGAKTAGDWIGARAGYLVAYAGLAVMGLAPGMLSRVLPTIVRKILKAVFLREAAAVADGAGDENEGLGRPRGWAFDNPAASAADAAVGVVPASSWRRAVDAGHPLNSEWDQFLSKRPELGADTLERMQIPPHGLQSAIERAGAPPGGWQKLCAATGAPIEPWMNVPGA